MSGNTTYEYMVGPSEEEIKKYFEYKRQQKQEKELKIEKKLQKIMTDEEQVDPSK